MAHKEPIRILFNKYLSGTISRDELKALLSYIAVAEEGDELSRYIQQEVEKESEPADPVLIDEIVNHVERRLFDQVPAGESPDNVRPLVHPGRTRRLLWMWGAAAAILIAVTFSFFLWFDTEDRTAETPDVMAIAPGGNRATLTLADGYVVDLKEDQTGIRVGEQLQYLDGSNIISDQAEPYVADYMLSTPKGGIYSVVLPDGSKVWLNAASTLKYPSRFGPGERTVELDGEGYFEVAKDNDRPFLVKSKGQVVRVLGTVFNVNAYHDEEFIITTLVEGAVSVFATDDSRPAGDYRHESSILLEPNQQARFNEEGIKVLRDVATGDFTAWRDGTFVFYGQSMPVVMRQIERWYDVSFANTELTENIELWGVLSRDVMLSQILETIELNTTLDFKQHERRITIHKNQTTNNQ